MTLGSKSKQLLLFVFCVLSSACGSKTQKPARAPVERQEAVAETAKPKPKKSGPDCSDGTCLPCGDAQCPKGFFCDESTPKATCQWVPTCSESVGCSCVERALSGKCSCTERDGGAYVRCSDS